MSRKLTQKIFLAIIVLAAFSMTIWADEVILSEPPDLPEITTHSSNNQVQAIAESSGDSDHQPFLSVIVSPPPWVDTQNKEAVEIFYLTEYMASEGIDSEWSGSHADCNPGTTSNKFRVAVLRRINYFRSMSGVPPLTGLSDEYNQKAQSAALMMSVNRQLDHTPPDTWLCYTDDGYDGASSSNLYLGVYGPSAISGYIFDPGDGNYFVGHRRWILYPQTKFMGTGDIPSVSGYPPSNALWVFDMDNMWGDRPNTREQFVAWPPPGYVPQQVIYPRWSFSYPQADFADTTVIMSRNGQPLNVTLNPIADGFGENTIVWEPVDLNTDNDIVYNVTLQNVVIDSVPQTFNYEVVAIIPPTLTPTNTPIPPTATPTNTPVPPTLTPIPPMATPTMIPTPTTPHSHRLYLPLIMR